MLQGLNENQLQAVQCVDGRVLILAGAGSGKTRVLTLRMAHLINNRGVSPKAILGLTFTNKAAAEMRNRMGQLMDASIAKQVTLCTFHSFCMQVLRTDIHHLGYTSEFTLYDEKDLQRLIALIVRDILGVEGELPSFGETLSAISLARNRNLKADQIEGGLWHDEFTRTVYKRLQDSMRAYNAVDFDNLLWLTVELFEKYPDILEKYQERFRYVMIDEYQDTNPVQYRLASLLTAKYQNLCVVGDDDQSIYGWRGADVRNILEFEKATVIKLEQNYRSTSVILKAANAVISNNAGRHAKMLWSNRGEGDPIEVFYAPDEVAEAQAVICRMDKLREKHRLRWSDIAILYRSNALSRQLEMALMKYSWKDGDRWVRGIPYQVFGGTEFYNRSEIKDLMAYLRLTVNPRDEEALLRIINQPRRGIGESTLDSLTQYNRKKEIPLWNVLKDISSPSQNSQELYGLKESINSKALKGITDFVQTIELAKAKFANECLKDTTNWMIDKIGFKKAIQEEVKSEQMQDIKWENVEEFISSMADYEAQFEGQSARKPSLHDFVTSTPLHSDWENPRKTDVFIDKANLMTFHSAKGLEFTACFLVAVEDTIIPHEKSLKETGIEEERRLMYVGITRAMKYLTISMAMTRNRMGVTNKCKPSRFVKEIPGELLSCKAWDKIE